jgi:hypothetical protein
MPVASFLSLPYLFHTSQRGIVVLRLPELPYLA